MSFSVDGGSKQKGSQRQNRGRKMRLLCIMCSQKVDQEFSYTNQRTLIFTQLNSYLMSCTELNRKCRAMRSQRSNHFPI